MIGSIGTLPNQLSADLLQAFGYLLVCLALVSAFYTIALETWDRISLLRTKRGLPQLDLASLIRDYLSACVPDHIERFAYNNQRGSQSRHLRDEAAIIE